MSQIASFGEWAKRRRIALHLTQEQLSQLVSCSVELIRKIESDTRRPSRAVATLLAKHLQVPPAELSSFIQCARGELLVEHLSPPLDDAAHAPVQAQARKYSLPVPLTPLIGRDEALANLRRYFYRTDVRLITVTGAPGVGKTRLSLQVAADLGSAFANGACLIELAAVRDPAGVASAIAQTLGVQGGRGRSIWESIKHYLRTRQLLLVLDNFEQVLAAAPQLADLLIHAPLLKALVSSRAPLHISGEHEFVLEPLALPPPEAPPTLEALARYPAIELFVERARAKGGDFALTKANAPAVATICAQLDGLPLAIELAAARIKLFPPQLMLSRLGNRFAFLTNGPRDLPDRQQTLQKTLDWSYQLLDEAEQRLFACLAVFVGGCTMEAAAAVYQAESDSRPDVVEMLASLIDKSLLRRTSDGRPDPRFSMLETLHEYARERLIERGELDRLRQRHAEYYLALVEQAEHTFRGPHARASMDRIGAEYANICAALTWSQAAPERADLGHRIAGALWWFWDQRSWSEGYKWLTMVTERPEPYVPTLARAMALTAAAFFANGLQKVDQAIELARAALALARKLGDPMHTAWALHMLGDILEHQGAGAEVTPLFEECLALFRAAGDRFGIARTLFVLGAAQVREGDTLNATALLQESHALFQALGDTSGTADPLWVLGILALDHNQPDRAVALLEASLALSEIGGDRWGIAHTLDLLSVAESERGNLERAMALLAESVEQWRDQDAPLWVALALHRQGALASSCGDHAGAAVCYRESLALYQALGHSPGIAAVRSSLAYVAHKRGDDMQAAGLLAENLTQYRDPGLQAGLADDLLLFGELAMARGQLAYAARLFSAAAHWRPAPASWSAELTTTLRVVDKLTAPFRQAELEHKVAAVRAQLGEAEFTAVWAAGQAMSLEQAIADAWQLEMVMGV